MRPDAAGAQSDLIPLDSAVRTGTLPNGLRYYIRKNTRPEKRLELRLVINAGSVLEDDDQKGLAHFVEHMLFNGTRRFAKNDIVSYLESIGVRFGADLNAYTGFDETVYILPVPTDKEGLVERSFDVLEDWAGGALFDSTEVVKERGVVLEEWRSGLGAGAWRAPRPAPFPHRLRRAGRRRRDPRGGRSQALRRQRPVSHPDDGSHRARQGRGRRGHPSPSPRGQRGWVRREPPARSPITTP